MERLATRGLRTTGNRTGKKSCNQTHGERKGGPDAKEAEEEDSSLAEKTGKSRVAENK